MTIDSILFVAKQYVAKNKKWHFHILTPECQLNDSGKYALVLENVTDNQHHRIYSDTPYMDIGKELITLLHGNDVIKSKTDKILVPPSTQVMKVLVRAKELSQKGIFWHHHMLFPDCMYNKYGKKWVIVFEDQEKGEIIESVTDNEPKGDLHHIEGLFYSQKK